MGYPYLVDEPPMATLMNWDVAANGMLYTDYDTDHNGKSDFHPLRIVVKGYFSSQTVQDVADSYPGYLVFVVDYGADHFFYVAEMYPLFYAIDVNEDGHWDLIYKDVLMDGVNGNEEFYNSPSGMFTSNIANF